MCVRARVRAHINEDSMYDNHYECNAIWLMSVFQIIVNVFILLYIVIQGQSQS